MEDSGFQSVQTEKSLEESELKKNAFCVNKPTVTLIAV